MRIVLVHPNYHSGGAEIAGNWPPAWVAYLAGHLKDAGFTDMWHFIDAMTNDLSDEDLAARLKELKPDVVGSTAITPSIYKAERVLEIAKEVVPDALRVLGGIHATFMYKQVLSEAPWIDVIVRGEGEEIFRELIRTPSPRGAGPREGRRSRASPISPMTARSSPPRPLRRSRISTPSIPTGRSSMEQVHLRPARRPRRHPQHGARLPVHLFVLQPVEVLARLPGPRSQKGGRRDREPGEGTTISASSSSPTRNPPSTARNSSSSARS
jgi:hypothetical protein